MAYTIFHAVTVRATPFSDWVAVGTFPGESVLMRDAALNAAEAVVPTLRPGAAVRVVRLLSNNKTDVIFEHEEPV